MQQFWLDVSYLHLQDKDISICTVKNQQDLTLQQ